MNTKSYSDLEREIKDLKVRLNDVCDAAGFFASAVRSGESWTARCDEELLRVMTARPLDPGLAATGRRAPSVPADGAHSPYLDIHRDPRTGALQLSIGDSTGGHRLHGQKFSRQSLLLLRHFITEDDAKKLIQYISKV
jgi:hypothetical protein